jgi:uncharacterized protein (TIGR02246 family)
MRILHCLLAILFIASGSQLLAADSGEQSIRQVLDAQVAAWNHGDIAAFMQGYQNSPETTFVGKTVQHGYAAVLERYRTSFPNRAAMGVLSFTDLQIRLLDAHCGVATGRFHLVRTPEAGGQADGIFSLVLVMTEHGWKITLDHTS